LFSKKSLIWLLSLAAASFLLTLLLLPFHEQIVGGPTSGADTYSRSALGYQAFKNVLEKWGYRVLVSRYSSEAKVSAGDLLVLAEPRPGKNQMQLKRMVRAARERGGKVLLVLPKWRGRPRPDKPEWIGDPELLPDTAVHRVLDLVTFQDHDDLCTERSAVSPAWSGPVEGASRLALAWPQTFRKECGQFESLVEGEGRLLIAASADRSMTVVADPDLLNNAGLGKGTNAAAFADLLAHEIQPKAIVIDESIHGYGRRDSIWARLLEFPLVILTLHILGLALLAGWAGMHRFGKPARLPPRVGEGKEVLLDNTARLLHQGRHWGHSGKRYLDMVLREVSAVYGVPRDLARLARLARAQGIQEDIEELDRRIGNLADQGADAGAALGLAAQVHRWRVAMTNAASAARPLGRTRQLRITQER